MNLFKISYLRKISVLFKEAFKFKKYKAMNPASAVFSGILMIPFLIFSFLITAFLFSLAFPFEIISSLVKSLHSILRDEGKEIKHATQFAIYWISWPIVFSLYITECMLLMWMIPTYALLSFLVYVWSFGGIKLHLFAQEDDDISVDVEGKYTVFPVIFTLFGYMLNLFIPIIHGILYYIYPYTDYKESIFIYTYSQEIYPKYFNLSLLFILVFSLIMSCYPRKKNNDNNKI